MGTHLLNSNELLKFAHQAAFVNESDSDRRTKRLWFTGKRNYRSVRKTHGRTVGFLTALRTNLYFDSFPFSLALAHWNMIER